MKFVMMVVMILVMGGVLRHGSRYLTQLPGAPEVPGVPGGTGPMEVPHFSSEESDLMGTVFKSALKLFTGQASREQLSGELSNKLYAGRDTATMSELGIELVKPDGKPMTPDAGGAGAANLTPGANPANAQPGSPAAAANTPAGAKAPISATAAKLLAKQHAMATASTMQPLVGSVVRTDVLGRVWERMKFYSIELSLIPVVFLGMMLTNRLRRRRSQGDEFMPSVTGILPPAESEPFDMKHAVHSLGTEEFELLVALIYQRQGYRVSMPAGLSGGKGGDFMLLRKAEKVLVQTKKLDLDHRVPVERVRELHEAMSIAGATRGLYVASCGFSWDARNFGKANKVTVINARTLDELIAAARENPEEDLLDVSQWVPKLMTKIQLTPPHCPACEAAMDRINATAGSVWVCSQRPDCRGRRIARKYQKPDPAAARKAEESEDGAKETGDQETVAANPTDGARKTSGIKQVENVTHPDPVRQAELAKLAEMARQALQAKRAARVRQEEQDAQAAKAKQAAPAAPASQARQVTPSTPGNRTAPASQARQAAPATPGNRTAPASQVRQVPPATPGSRTAPASQARQVTPATPGNRTTPANPTRKVVPATPGNRGNS
ncbi:MAG: restriction endonuclease [Chthoniobacter sp.]|nr:restriction endonuclease [Chthoniobacter sp.]